MRLTAILYGAKRTNLFELRPLHGGDVPEFSAGAHVDVYLPNGTIRQYSIASGTSDRARYLLGVKLETDGRGGSRCMHEELRVGQVLKIGLPRNNFPLVEEAAQSIFIAGGIGITPIKCMIDRLQMLGRPWRLHYAVRTRDEALFADDFSGAGDRLHLHVDCERGGEVIDVDAIVASAPQDAQLYCCGPAPMLAAVRARLRRPAQKLRASRTVQRAGQCRCDRRRLHRRAGALETFDRGAAGQTLCRRCRPPASRSRPRASKASAAPARRACSQASPDHRDMILSDDEKAANDTMMVCCSGSLGPTLVLDL